MDDIRVFVKDEPHKQSKVQEGRWRLIMCMSLEDQMVDRILFQSWSQAEKDFTAIPGKTGWSPIPSGYRLFNTQFPGDVLATDCSAWDWTCPEWVPDAILRMRKAQMKGYSQEYWTAVTTRFACVLRDAVVRLPDGRRFRQEGWGLLKSGWYRTIAFNSSALTLINLLAWKRAGFEGELPRIWTMGDDVLLAWSDQLDQTSFEEALATTGILVKRGQGIREFAGFYIDRQYVTPCYTDKHVFALAHVPPTQMAEVAESYTLLYSLAYPEAAEKVLPYVEPYSVTPSLVAKQWARGGLMLRS